MFENVNLTIPQSPYGDSSLYTKEPNVLCPTIFTGRNLGCVFFEKHKVYLLNLNFVLYYKTELIKARQIVKPSATLLSINSIGDKYPKHLRGLLLIKETTDSNCS